MDAKRISMADARSLALNQMRDSEEGRKDASETEAAIQESFGFDVEAISRVANKRKCEVIFSWEKACACDGLSSMPQIEKSRTHDLTGKKFSLKSDSIIPPQCGKCETDWKRVMFSVEED